MIPLADPSKRDAALARARAAGIVAAYRLAIALAGRVPPRVAYPILDAAGDLLRRASPGGRAAVADNLAHVLGGRGPRHARAVRLAFRHALRNYYDTFRLPAMTLDEIADFVPIDGDEHVRAALARGNGAICVTAHVSSLVVGAQALAQRFGGATVAVEPLDPPELLDVISAARGSHSLRMAPLGPTLAVELGAALRRDELVFLAVDRAFGAATVPVPFFGAPAHIPSGPALLALRTGAAIIPAFVSRRADGRLQGVVHPPIPLTPSGNLRADVARITADIARRLEYHIGKHPEQWTVLQRVWGDAAPPPGGVERPSVSGRAESRGDGAVEGRGRR
jgi:phosphatidylinositol dimannoside acyltransferase